MQDVDVEITGRNRRGIVHQVVRLISGNACLSGIFGNSTCLTQCNTSLSGVRRYSICSGFGKRHNG